MRMAFLEDKMIRYYGNIMQYPLLLMEWIHSIDAYYLLLYPYLLNYDRAEVKQDKYNKNVDLEGRVFFETRIRDLLKEGWEIQNKNQKSASKGQGKIMIPGEFIAKCRETMIKLSIMKNYLGFGVKVTKKRSIDDEWHKQYSSPKKGV